MAAYHQATNGQAERYVQIIKKSLLKLKSDDKFENNLLKILAQYRNMPHTTTGISPAELMFNRKLRIKLDLLKDNSCKLDKQCINDKIIVNKNFVKGETVGARSYKGEKSGYLVK